MAQDTNGNGLEDLDFGETSPFSPEPAPEKKPGNRNFLIALGVIGGIFILLTIALIVVAVVILPGQRAAREQQQAAVLAANTATAQAATLEAEKALIPPTFTPAPPTAVLPTNTPVIVQATSTATVAPTQVSDAQKATLSAQQTQVAGGKLTTTVIPTSTALPTTGFADEVGLPGLIALGGGLILLILLVRRLRFTNAA